MKITDAKNIYQTDYTKTPEIFTLIKEHKNEDAKEYLKQNPTDVHLKGWMDDTPLHIASLSGNLEMVKYLIENGANVNAERSGIYATPLCWTDNFDIAKFLLDKGATMNDRELSFATSQDKVEVVNLLLESGAKIDTMRPQYLECNSIDCVKIYLKHGIKIDATDENKSTLLHKLAWLDRPDAFDFAYKNGCPWQKDSSQRNPYYLARQGNRKKILNHFKKNYPELISHKIENYSIAEYKYERLFFLKQSPTKSDEFIGLTNNAKLVKYILCEGELMIDRIASIDISYIRNFTFDKEGNIIIPTNDNRILVIEQITFQLLYYVDLQEELILDQIEFLPLKNIYIGSGGSSWEILLLSTDFKIISRTRAEDGTILPKINQDESLISFMSYDQETYFNLYKLNDDLSIEFIHTFFKDRNNTSTGFDFNNNEFIVSFPNEMEYYSFKEGMLNQQWEIDISKYKSEHGLSFLTFLNENLILIGKGKLLLYVDIKKKSIFKEEKLDLLAEIRELYLDNEKKNLFISTDKELKLISLSEKNMPVKAI